LPDFGDIKKKLTAEEEDKKRKTAETNQLEQTFTEEELREAWGAFLEKLKAENRTSEYNALNQKFYLTEGHHIRLEIINSYQLHMIERIRTDLLEFLRKKLKNKNILLDTRVIEPEEKKLIYTNKEKFNFLAEKYPLLNELKKRFGLETDF
jgi:DNA polymerase-3 subunit gamma/tau